MDQPVNLPQPLSKETSNFQEPKRHLSFVHIDMNNGFLGISTGFSTHIQTFDPSFIDYRHLKFYRNRDTGIVYVSE